MFRKLAFAILLLLLSACPALAVVTSALVDSTSRTGSTGTTSTVTGVLFGTAFTGRVIVAYIAESTGANLTSATIGGVTASMAGSQAQAEGFMIAAVVPTGTSGNIVCVWSKSDTTLTEGVYALTGAASATPSATINTSGASATINIGAGGSLVAGAFDTGTWTGITKLFNNTSFGASSGTFDNAGGAITGHTVAISGGLIVAMAFTAGAGPPPAAQKSHGYILGKGPFPSFGRHRARAETNLAFN